MHMLGPCVVMADANGDGGNIVMGLEPGITTAGQVFPLEGADVVPDGGETSLPVETGERPPVARAPGFGLGQEEAVGEQQDVRDTCQACPAVTQEVYRFRFAVEHAVGDVHLQPHLGDLVGKKAVDRLVVAGNIPPELQGLAVDVQFRRKQAVPAVTVQQHDHAVAGMAVLEGRRVHADDSHAGRP